MKQWINYTLALFEDDSLNFKDNYLINTLYSLNFKLYPWNLKTLKLKPFYLWKSKINLWIIYINLWNSKMKVWIFKIILWISEIILWSSVKFYSLNFKLFFLSISKIKFKNLSLNYKPGSYIHVSVQTLIFVIQILFFEILFDLELYTLNFKCERIIPNFILWISNFILWISNFILEIQRLIFEIQLVCSLKL